MTKAFTFYTNRYSTNLIEEIELAMNKFIQTSGERPNKIAMNCEMFNRLMVEQRNTGCYVINRATVEDTIFGMKLDINDCLDNKICLYKEENMGDDFIDSMRYSMGNWSFNTVASVKKVNDKLPKKYIINKGATVLFWEDGSKTVVKRGKDDEYNKVMGFLWAYFQKTSGMSRTKANKYLASLVDEDDIKLMEMIKNKELNTSMADVLNGISEAFNNMAKGLIKDTIDNHKKSKDKE